ncbi:FecR family protein [Ottowia thiooxydans]|uniref:Transmembrane sensor n=1 Tax=Ottowia thiooxydans TaxID=219182 RepID=A0ABV2Q214_9BURK
MSAPTANHIPIPEHVRKKAAAWLVELQSDEVGEHTRYEWQRWRAAHPDHERAWQRIESLGTKLQALQPALAHAALSPAKSSGRRRTVQALAVALFAGGIAWVGEERVPWRQWAADRRTGVGERDTIMLPDGTRIELNSDTAIELAFSDSERGVRLVAGEIFVASGPDDRALSRPFFVYTAEGRVQPIGTQFTVRQTVRGQSTVAVYAGAVMVQPEQGSPRLLNAGEQARFTREQVAEPVDADESSTAWIQGIIVAQDMPLAAFIAELARYRSGWLGCADSVAHLRVTGTYPVSDTTKVLGMLTRALPVEIHYRTRFWASVQPSTRSE